MQSKAFSIKRLVGNYNLINVHSLSSFNAIIFHSCSVLNLLVYLYANLDYFHHLRHTQEPKIILASYSDVCVLLLCFFLSCDADSDSQGIDPLPRMCTES